MDGPWFAVQTEVYKLFLFSLLAAGAWGADQTVLTLTIRAQTDFDRVEGEAFPNVEDTTRCAQSQAQLLPLVRPAEVPLVRFRKGYCEILDARFSGNRGEYRQAAQDFAQAMAAWPAQGLAAPMSSGLEVLSAIARLEAGAEPDEVKPGLADAQARAACPAGVMSERLCGDLLRTGRLWQGWIALQQGDLSGAAAVFAQFPGFAWAAWTAGRQAEAAHRYPEAVESLAKAVEAWGLDQRYPKPGLERILGPRPDVAEATAELGAAQYLAGQFQAAIGTLDAAIKARPDDGRSLFLRGLAREALGESAAALTDYQQASRAAFANPDRPFATGRAHFYRGVWYYRRGAFSQAEDEFSSALNADPGPDLRPDVAAWRQLAAVAGGSCGAAAAELRSAIPSTTARFPRQDAERRLAACIEQPQKISRK